MVEYQYAAESFTIWKAIDIDMIDTIDQKIVGMCLRGNKYCFLYAFITS